MQTVTFGGFLDYAKYQPKDGDIVLVCEHIDALTDGQNGSTNANSDNLHWFKHGDVKGPPIYDEFTRPDGSTGVSAWFCVCEECRDRYAADIVEAIRGDVTWIGDGPTIRAYHPN